MTKRTLELKEPIEAVADEAGGWVARLSLLDIEVRGTTEEEARSSAFIAMLEHLDAMGEAAAKEWIETNSVQAPPGASCSL